MTVTTDFNGIPFPRYPISNITPFTYRDGLTFLEMIEDFRKYINSTILTGVNGNMLIMLQNYEAALTEIINQGDANLADLTTLVDQFADDAQAQIDKATEIATTPVANLRHESSQNNMASIFASMGTYDKVQVSKIDTQGTLTVTATDGEGNSVEHYLSAPSRYRVFGQVRVESDSSTELGVTETIQWGDSRIVTTGTFSAATTAAASFTTVVGDSFKVPCVTHRANAQVRLRTHRDPRGGKWRLSVDDHPEFGIVEFSTWNATAEFNYANPPLVIPVPGSYTVRAEFLGADPDHAPAGGVPARGWTGALISNFFTVWQAGAFQVITPTSNKDFAFNVGKPGDAPQFIPHHGVDGTESIASPPRYFDGVTEIFPDAYERFDVHEMKNDFRVVQHIYGRNPASGTENLIEIWTTQIVSPNGIVRVNGRWKVLSPIQVYQRQAYHTMLMGNMAIFDEVVSSLGKSYTVQSANAGTNIPLTDGSTSDGYALLSSTTDFVAALDIDNRALTLRVGDMNRPPEAESGFIEQRPSPLIAKVYQRLFDNNAVLLAGEMFSFSGTYYYGSLPGAYGTFSRR